MKRYIIEKCSYEQILGPLCKKKGVMLNHFSVPFQNLFQFKLESLELKMVLASDAELKKVLDCLART